MKRFNVTSCWAVWLALAGFAGGQEAGDPFAFQFDRADETVPATLLENPNYYDAGIASRKEGLWLAWLEFQPGKGDQLWIGQWSGGGWISKQQLSEKPGDFARPTPTIDARGDVWVTYEAASDGFWNVLVQHQGADGKFATPLPVFENRSADVNHAVAAHPKGGIYIVWQNDNGGQFDIAGSHIATPVALEHRALSLIADSKWNSWHPRAAVNPSGAVHVIWDEYDGRSHDVLQRSFTGGRWSDTRRLADTPGFEAHAQIVFDKNGKLWVAWEEDGDNWGGPYTARVQARQDSHTLADQLGPLHRFRRLHVAALDAKTGRLREHHLPQPSFDLARKRKDAPAGVKDTGVYYERAQLAVDGQNRPWIVYRHFYAPWLGVTYSSHKQENARIYARCLLTNGWSKLFSFDIGQGDGMQRISVTPLPDGIAVAWTCGRTDRRTRDERDKNDKTRGVAIAEIHLNDAKAVMPAQTRDRRLNRVASEIGVKPRQRPATEFAGKRYELFYGDLHRHTDISLCYSPADGTIDDAYRYAIDVAQLDFLGITDHTHDLDWGEPLAQIWWRSRKEVDRHALRGRFIPFYAYERSRGDTDHNVISLRDDVMRPHTYPLANFWQELDSDTFTIPHQPVNPATWNHKDDDHRPLMEIYQGFRNLAVESDAHEGLARGHRIGFIASSDHLSTSASYACVWAEEPTRESIFRAMQARRTFGATAKIVLKVTAGDHWMGGSFKAKSMPPIRVEATGTAPIERMDLILNGEVRDSLTSTSAKVQWTPKLDPALAGNHILFVRLFQKDGHRAWSSPIWLEIEP